MCRCTPNIRTPFCGRPGCEWPKQEPKQPPPVKRPQVTGWVWGADGVGDEVKLTIRVPDEYREAFMARLMAWLDGHPEVKR